MLLVSLNGKRTMPQMSNRNKLVANIIGLFFIGFITASTVAYQHVKFWQEQAIQDELLLNATKVVTQLDSWAEKRINQVDDFAKFIATSADSNQKHNHYKNYINQHPELAKIKYLGYSLEPDGDYNIADWQVPNGYDPRKRSWYVEGKAANKPFIGTPYVSADNTGKVLLAITSPIIRQGMFVGLASAHITLDFIQKQLNSIDVNMQGQAFLIDQQGMVIAHSDSQQLGSLWPGFVNINGNTSGEIQVSESTTEFFFLSSFGHKYQRQFVLAIPKKIIEQTLFSEALKLLSKFFLIFILIIALFYLSNRHFILPLFDYMELDNITLLPSKKHFKQQLLDSFLLPGKQGKLLLIAMDNFNRLTATYSASQVHFLQNKIKERIQSQLTENLLLGSFSESRYIAYYDCKDEPSKCYCGQLLIDLADVLAKPYQVAGQEINCSFRIGASYFPDHGNEVESLIDNAFSALANIKPNQDKHYAIFSPIINQKFSKQQFIHDAMSNAIRSAELTMVYQPQIDSNSGKMFAMEALIRWHSSQLKRTISPGEFIPIAESSGLMVLLGDYIIESVFKQISLWNTQGVEFGLVSINISPCQLLMDDFYPKLKQSIEIHSVSPQQVELEITETALLENPITAIEVLHKLKADGFAIAIDDFGTGYSSLQYLNMMPLNKLKIDRAFIIDLDKNPKNAVLVKTIIAMAQNLNLDVLAEGVERIDEVKTLADLGCHKIQGYFYSKPLPAEALLDYILENTPSDIRVENG
jgi:EAL domain-containing protein (putative c-di-GMP-specific phosphodiesterase class I)/GGDEF domain-containing protein